MRELGKRQAGWWKKCLQWQSAFSSKQPWKNLSNQKPSLSNQPVCLSQSSKRKMCAQSLKKKNGDHEVNVDDITAKWKAGSGMYNALKEEEACPSSIYKAHSNNKVCIYIYTCWEGYKEGVGREDR